MSRYEFDFRITRSYDELLKWALCYVKDNFDTWVYIECDISTPVNSLKKDEKYKLLDEYIEDEIKSNFLVLDDNTALAEERTKLVYERLKEDLIKLQQGQDIIDELKVGRLKL